MNSTIAMHNIAHINLDPVKRKLMHKESGEGWTAARADAIEVEYRRFLCMMELYPEEQFAPLVDVDTFWHYHILDTRKYAADCQRAFGHFVHHNPNVGLGEDDAADHQAYGERMHALYLATFGEACLTGAHAGGATAWCSLTNGASGQETAWCSLTAGASDQQTAWCSLRSGVKTQTTVTAATATTSTAWCSGAYSASMQKANTAWCSRVDASALPQTAWCSLDAGVQTAASLTAWCSRVDTPLAQGTAWCSAPAA